jgi:hypothetical protein
MRRFRTTIVLAFATLLSISICSAQQTATTSVPNLVRYSGTLKDAQGAAVSSSTAVGVTFSIYKQQDGGASVWMETQNVTPDANGQYSVILGSTTATGLPDDLFLQQEQRWLGVQVQGEAEQARVLLVSVPYAFKAHEAETLGGLPASAFVKAPPSAGGAIGTYGDGTAVNALGTAGKAGGTSAPGGIKTVSDCLNPTLGAITLWSKQIQISPPIWELCNSNLFQVLTGPSAGNIGIGNTNPSKSLDVSGEINTRKWYDIASPELAFAGVGFFVPNTNRDTFVGVGAGTPAPLIPPATPLGETDNTFVGYYAGSNTRFNGTAGTGIYNTFTGSQAGRNNIIGSQNTFNGYKAGFANTANGNSFFGYQAGLANLGGSQNAFFGNDAGLSNIGGNANTFSGNGAGFFHINGNQNTFSGTSAGFNDYHGQANTCIGASACQDNDVGPGHVSGNFNTYVGVSAGQNAFGSTNTFIGRGAGFGGPPGANNNGSFNTFSGNNAGANNTTGSYNTSYGYLAGVNNATGNSNVYLANFGANESNTIRIGMKGPGNQQQKIVFFDPILPNGTPTNYDAVTIEKNTGQLGHVAFPSGGGGNVVGPGNCLTNFLTKWAGSNNVDCSHIWENPASTYFVGIGTTAPGAQLDVNGLVNPASPSGINTTDTRNSYMIGNQPVLSVNPLGIGNENLFVGWGTGSGGTYNTFVGDLAGGSSTSGVGNTLVGAEAGYSGTAGQNNTFVGYWAGKANGATGSTCVGYGACQNNASGGSNTFVGGGAGQSQLSGSHNTFVGSGAGTNISGGNSNIFVGDNAGFNTLSGSGDIYLGSQGPPSPGAEPNTIRIGNQGTQTATFVAGIFPPTTPTGVYQVCVNSLGQLFSIQPFTFCNSSSRRFKEQISDMGDSSSKLLQLHPVTYFYKPQYDDGSHLLQYGLIAEEVAKVYPEMVAYEKDGQPYTVKYQLLAPMLLNELQKQHKVVAAQQDELQTQLQQIKTQQQQMQAQRHEIDGLKLQLQQQNASLQERLQRLESYVATQMKTAKDDPPRTAPGANGGLQ